MDDRYRHLDDRTASNGGFWLREDARAAGFSDTAITEHVSSGRWSAWFGHVLAPAAMPVTWENRARAASLRVGADGVLSGRTSARLWGLAGFEDAEELDVLVPRDHTPRIAGITLFRDPDLRPDELVRLEGFRRVAKVTRTLRTLARVVDDEDLLARAAADGYRRGRTSPGEIQREILAHPGATGNPRLSRVVRRLDPRMARAREVSETDVVETLVDIGVERFEVNVRRVLGCGRRVEFDVLLLADDGHDESVLEVDGARWHGDVLAQRHDAERRRAVRADGYPLEVITARQARDRRRVAAAVADLRRQARR